MHKIDSLSAGVSVFVSLSRARGHLERNDMQAMEGEIGWALIWTGRVYPYHTHSPSILILLSEHFEPESMRIRCKSHHPSVSDLCDLLSLLGWYSLDTIA